MKPFSWFWARILLHMPAIASAAQTREERVEITPLRSSILRGESLPIVVNFFLPRGSVCPLDLHDLRWTIEMGSKKATFEEGSGSLIAESRIGDEMIVRGGRPSWIFASLQHGVSKRLVEGGEFTWSDVGEWTIRVSGFLADRGTGEAVRFESAPTEVSIARPDGEDAVADALLTEEARARDEPAIWSNALPMSLALRIAKEAPGSRFAPRARARALHQFLLPRPAELVDRVRDTDIRPGQGGEGTPPSQAETRGILTAVVRRSSFLSPGSCAVESLEELTYALRVAIRLGERDGVAVLVNATRNAARRYMEEATAVGGPQGYVWKARVPYSEEALESLLGVEVGSAAWSTAFAAEVSRAVRAIEGEEADLRVLTIAGFGPVAEALNAIDAGTRYMDQSPR